MVAAMHRLARPRGNETEPRRQVISTVRALSRFGTAATKGHGLGDDDGCLGRYLFVDETSRSDVAASVERFVASDDRTNTRDDSGALYLPARTVVEGSQPVFGPFREERVGARTVRRREGQSKESARCSCSSTTSSLSSGCTTTRPLWLCSGLHSIPESALRRFRWLRLGSGIVETKTSPHNVDAVHQRESSQGIDSSRRRA